MKQFAEHEWAELESHLAKLGNGITRAIFEEWLKLDETQKTLVEKYGENYSLWQALSHMVKPPVRTRAGNLTFEQGTKKRRSRGLGGDRSYKADDEGEPESGDPGGGLPEEEFNRRVQQRMDDYLLAYKDVAPNDMASLRDLCLIEVNIELLNGLVAREYGKGEPDGSKIGRYLYALKGASEQHRALQRSLHIDRATREREAAKASDVDEVMQVIDAAGEYVEEQGIPLVHYGCTIAGAQGKSDIQFGFMLWVFRELPVDVVWLCPRCGQQVTVHHTPTAEDLRAAAEPAWVGEEEAHYRANEEKLRGGKDDDGDDPNGTPFGRE